MDHFKVMIAAKYWEMCSFTRRDFDQLDGYYYSWSQLWSAVWLALFSLWSTRQIWRIHPFTSQSLDSISLLQCMPHHCYCPDLEFTVQIVLLPWQLKRPNCVSTLQWHVSDSRQPLNISSRHRSFSTLVTNTECTEHTHPHVVPVGDAFFTGCITYTWEN